MSCWKTLQIVCCVLAVVVITAACGLAVEVVPIEGKLLVTGIDLYWNTFGYYLEDSSDNVVNIPLQGIAHQKLSPREDQIAFTNNNATPRRVGKANLDGTNCIDLTGPGTAADIGGINCWPRWSPDGSQIAFLRMDPFPGQIPCEAGFETWVINSDGTGVRRVSPDGYSMHPWTWTPDGYRIACVVWSSPLGTGNCLIDADGSDLEMLSIPGGELAISADGSQVAYAPVEFTTRDGQPGVLMSLAISNIDGSNAQLLVENFTPESDIWEHLTLIGNPLDEWNFLLVWLFSGPVAPCWSPNGDRIVFSAAGLGATTPTFDPLGPPYWTQDELWVYDLSTSGLTRITDNLWSDLYADWRGANTSPSHPEVTVNNTTVSFPTVQEGVDGLTTIIRDDDPPPMDTGYQFCGEYYEISTTLPEGSYTLPITITMTYKDEEVPGGNEGALELLHYNEVTGLWDNITTERNTVENWVKGETSSLSLFGLGLRTPVWLEPLKNDTSEASPAGPFKRGRTIPVKFRIMDTNGQPLADAEAQALHPVLQVFYERPCVEGTPSDPGETLPDVGAEFRYDAEGDLFIYNLSTKDPAWLVNYTYGLEVLIGGAKAGAVYFSLR